MKSIIVGFGRIANSIRLDKKIAKVFKYASHAQVLAEHPDFKWIGVVDPSPDAQAAARVWGIQPGVLKDFEEAEFAVLTVPSELRQGIVESLPNLKAVMIEKPMGDTGEAFLKYCEWRDIEVTVNFWRRGVPFFQEMARAGVKNCVGDIQVVNCLYGNGVMNNGSHLIDFIHMMFGDVGLVATHKKPRTLKSLGCSGPMDDYSVPFTLEMVGGFDVHVAPIDFGKYREVSMDIWGTKGRLCFMQESLVAHQYKVTDHRAMENQKEVNTDMYERVSVDVSRAFFNLYTSIAKGESLSPGRQAIKTEEVLKGIIS